MGLEIGGPIGLLILALDVYAIIRILESAASNGGKVLWILVILILPVLGFILWLLLGPRQSDHLRRA